MRRSYEYKEESYIVHERGSWDSPSYEKYYEAPTPNIQKMLYKPSFEYSHPSSYGHHNEDACMVLNKTHWGDAHDHQASRVKYVDNRDEDGMTFGGSRWDGSRGWSGTHPMNDGRFGVKKIEHQGFRTKNGHHDEDVVTFDGSQWVEGRNWGGTHQMNNENSARKRVEHQAFSTKYGDTLGGSQWAKDRNWGGTHQMTNENSAMKKTDLQTFRNKYGQHGKDETTFGGSQWAEGRNWGGAHDTTNNNWMEASKEYEGYDNHASNNNSNWKKASKQIEDYDARLKGGVESLIKGLYGSGLGGKVHKIEVIEYERSTRYGGGGGITTYHP